MEKLYLIMRDFLEVAYNQESLLCLLMAVEAAYTGEEQEESKLFVSSTIYYLKVLQKDLKSDINKMDSYIAENVKNR